jgi:hypothetical protein
LLHNDPLGAAFPIEKRRTTHGFAENAAYGLTPRRAADAASAIRLWKAKMLSAEPS